MMKLLSLNVGKPSMITHNKKPVLSGINKFPAGQALFLHKTGFAEDGQADLVNHGGKDKAVCVYAHEHYQHWEQVLNRPLLFGAFGENMTVEGLLETNVHIGDQFQIGEAVVQISQPRQPCFKLAAKYGEAKLPLYVQETGFTGFYFRVLQEGAVQASSSFTRISHSAGSVTVQEANQVMYAKYPDQDLLKTALQTDALAASWRTPFLTKLQSHDKK